MFNKGGAWERKMTYETEENCGKFKGERMIFMKNGKSYFYFRNSATHFFKF